MARDVDVSFEAAADDEKRYIPGTSVSSHVVLVTSALILLENVMNQEGGQGLTLVALWWRLFERLYQEEDFKDLKLLKSQ